MPFKIDFLDGEAVEWSLTGSGADHRRVPDYRPTLYATAEVDGGLDTLAEVYRAHPDVERVAVEAARRGWRHEPEPVLRLDVASLDAVTTVASELRRWGDPGTYRPYNVDLTREFRYCLENDVSPAPQADPTVLELGVPPKQLNDRELSTLAVDDETLRGTPADLLSSLAARLADRDPDVLAVSSGELVPFLYREADAAGVEEFELGRLAGWQRLAGRSTFESYGAVGHSPARYNVPGRAIVDRSNSFFWRRSGLAGILDLVDRSRKSIQETAWASIGNVLTAIQISHARSRGVLVPWNSWRHERFKPMSVLRDADRGGFTFSPDAGFHEGVHELDFSSLYPNIIVTKNVSPERVCCDCHADRADVPGLGYSICDEPGYLPKVLAPIVEDRDTYKAEIRRLGDCARRDELRRRSEALKWILVACFGYQGFSNAKFGRIECHEAINAFAREIILEAKETLEANGWRVVHGIVDSLWVQAVAGEDRTPLPDVAREISEEIGIRLEYEAEYDWIAFVPRVDSEAGALNRYFGKVAGADEFKKRGIEVRRRSTPAFVAECQLSWLETLDAHRDPERVLDRLAVQLARLRSGSVDPESLLVRKRVSKPLEAYTRSTRNVAALERATRQHFAVHPGEDVRYLVVDDAARSAERVRLAYEALDDYDADYYSTLLVRAAESVVSPFGWTRGRIERYLADTTETRLSAYT